MKMKTTSVAQVGSSVPFGLQAKQNIGDQIVDLLSSEIQVLLHNTQL